MSAPAPLPDVIVGPKEEQVKIPNRPRQRDLVSRFPPEIGGLIFCYAVIDPIDQITGVDGNIPKKTYAEPLRLSQVCWYWRRLAKSIPSLWTRLVLVPSWRDSNKHLSSPVLRWFYRSRRLPLAIYFDATRMLPSSKMQYVIGQCMYAISCFRHRVVSLHLRVPRWSLRYLQLWNPKPIYRLRHFIIYDTSDVVEPRQKVVDKLPVMPAKVRPLRPTRVACYQDFFGTVHWEDVTTLDLISVTFISCLPLLQACPRLQSLSMNIHDRAVESILFPEYTGPSLTLPHLTMLSLKGSVGLSEYTAMKWLILPKLTELTIDTRTRFLNVVSLRILIERWGQPRVRSLTVHIKEADADRVLDLIELLPSVATLNVTRHR